MCAYVSRACTTHVPRERATDRARASKSNASASDTPGSRSFLRSYVGLLARALCPSLSPWAFPVRLPRGLSFAPSLSAECVHSFTIVRSLSRCFLLTFDLCCRRSPSLSFFLSVTLSMRHDHPRPIVSDLPVRTRLLLSYRFTNLSTFSLLFFLKCSPSFMIRPCLSINATPIAPV